MRTMLYFIAAGLMWGGLAYAQHQYPTAEVPTSEPAYLAKVKTAAPEHIVNKATIIMMQEGKPRELQAGSNGFTCLISPDGTPLCADQNGMEWMKSVRERKEPPDTIGFIYMLAGDTGTTNHLKLSAPGAYFGKKPRPLHLTKYSTNHNHCEFKGHRFWRAYLLCRAQPPVFYGFCRLFVQVVRNSSALLPDISANSDA